MGAKGPAAFPAAPLGLAVAVAAAVAGTVLLLLNQPAGPVSLVRDGIVPALLGVAYAAVGALVAARQPANRVAWLFTAIGVSFALAQASAEYAVRGLVTAPGSLPGPVLGAWMQGPLFVVAVTTGLPLLLLLFPNGRAPAPRWRVVGWLALVTSALILAVSIAAAGSMTSSFRHVALHAANPTGFLRVPLAVDAVLSLAEVGTLLAAGAALVWRLRHAHGVERQQVKWLAYVGALLSASFAGNVLIPPGTLSDLSVDAFAALAALGVPAATAVAILRHNLYDIDVVIARSVVYGALAAFITVVYVGIVVGAGAVTGSSGPPGLLPSVLAAAVVAAAFQPVRERLQRLANRLVYGARATPYEVLASYSHRLAATLSPDEVLPRTAEAAGRAVGARASRARLFLPGGEERTADWPPGAAPASFDLSVPVRASGDGPVVGAVSVAKATGEPLTAAEQALLTDLAGQAALAFGNVRLTVELQRHLEAISARAGEIRASRQRLVAAAGAGRARLEREIRRGPERQLAAIGASLTTAEALLEPDPAAAGALLAELTAAANSTLEALRDLARGVFPPLLADRGPVAALRAHVRKAGLAAHVEADAALSAGRFGPEVEAALYFCGVAALEDAGRRGPGAELELRLAAADGWLELTAPAPGAGALREMADRVEALAGTVDGTGGRMVVRLPAGSPQG